MAPCESTGDSFFAAPRRITAYVQPAEPDLQHTGRLHGLGQVRDDILGILQADAEAEEALPIDSVR